MERKKQHLMALRWSKDSAKPTNILSSSAFTWQHLKSNTRCTGFTLVEVVASLLIVGILGAIAGMGLVTGMRGYMQAKENGHLSQKAQVAMARIKRELMEITAVIVGEDGTEPWVIFDNPAGRQALRKTGKIVQLFILDSTKTDLDGVTGDTLIDQVDQERPEKSFEIKYKNGSENWTIGDNFDLLSSVEVNLVLRRAEGRAGDEGTVIFSTVINPRNNKNAGGANITDDDVTRAAGRYDCFITTASSGYFWMKTISAKRSFIAAGLIGIFGIVSALGYVRNRRSQKRPGGGSSLRGESGHVLVALVVTLLLFAALGAGMVSLIGSSATSQVIGEGAARAYYIAESGFRYAASRYLNTTDANGICKSQDEKSQTLAALHDALFTLSGDDGRFRLNVLPYFLTVNGTPALGSTAVATRFSGGRPEGFALPSNGVNARMKIGDTIYPYTYYNDNTGQLTLSEPLAEDVCAGAVVKLVGFPAGGATISKNGDLALADGGFFPETQGQITIHGVSYGYKSRDDNVLHDVTKVKDADESFSVSVDTATEVVLAPFVQVRSIGMVGQGELASTRQIIYSVPLPDKSREIVEFRDPFNDLSNWSSPTYGSFAIENRGGENVLAVTDVEPGLGVLKAGLIAFNWATNKVVNFAYSHRLAGYYLSYDNQVKIGFDATPFPETGYGPEGAPIPKHYVAGLAFRLDENENFYGLSFMRGCAFCSPADRIPDEIVPENDVNLVVLWQQTGNGTSRKWLAYSELGLLFSDGAELEPPSGKWISENDHAGDPLWTRADNFAHSPSSYSWTTSPSG
ncbi:MAG: prepilin-type N-terminal cleavage/methylation domain-containing protein, partial [Desulfobacterales bacterium]